MLSIVKTLILLTLIAILPMAVAQSGRPMNSVDPVPGTSVPIAPTDSVHPGEKPGARDAALPASINLSSDDVIRDAGSSKSDRKASRKLKSQQKVLPNDTH